MLVELERWQSTAAQRFSGQLLGHLGSRDKFRNLDIQVEAWRNQWPKRFNHRDWQRWGLLHWALGAGRQFSGQFGQDWQLATMEVSCHWRMEAKFRHWRTCEICDWPCLVEG